MSDFHRLKEAYEGNNPPHRVFVINLVNLKLYHSLFSRYGREHYANLLSEIAKYSGTVAEITQVISNTQFKGIPIRPNEIDISSLREFSKHYYNILFVSIHRVFFDYLIGHYEYLSKTNVKVPKVDGLTYKDNLINAYDKICLPITPLKGEKTYSVQWYKDRFNELGCIRNVIEHHDSIVDDKFTERCKTTQYKEGDKIIITTEKIGDAINLVQYLAEDLDTRGYEKYIKD